MRRIIAGFIIFLILVGPAAAAPVINPSVESQPMLCRFYYTSWICDVFGGGKGLPGPQGLPGAPGTGNITNYFDLIGNVSSWSNITNFWHMEGMNQTPNMTAGPEGPTGSQGIQGIQGIPGLDNMTAGPQGEVGSQGIQGIQGEKGDTGEIPDSSQFLFLNGTRMMTGVLNSGGNRISNISAPTTDGDALNYQAWTPWTTVLTWTGATPGGVTTVARWTKIGKTVYTETQIYALDSNATTGLTFTLPIAHASNGIIATGTAIINNAGVISQTPFYIFSNSNVLGIWVFPAGTDNQIYRVYVNAFYEV